MSSTDNETLETPAAADEIIWPRPVPGLRSLTREELEGLEAALETRLDREHLKHWLSTSISNTVALASRPTARQAREELKKLASEGRKWLDQVDSDPIKALLEQKVPQEHKGCADALRGHEIKIKKLKGVMVEFCELIDSTASEAGRLIKRGGQRSTSPALIAFLQNMIGIAKWNKVLPSTPQRHMYSKNPPAFFTFVEEALATARDVIELSYIPSDQKQRAIKSLRYASRDALIRILERKRGLIRNYHDSHHGLEDAGQRGIRRGRKIRG